VVAEQDGTGVELDHLAEAGQGRLEDLAEIQRRRKRLGEVMKRRQQDVCLTEPAHAVYRSGALFLRLAEELAGVGGDRGHEHKLDTPKSGGGGKPARGGVERDAHNDADRAQAGEDERAKRRPRCRTTGARERVQL
jgi:hypothetical protein